MLQKYSFLSPSNYKIALTNFLNIILTVLSCFNYFDNEPRRYKCKLLNVKLILRCNCGLQSMDNNIHFQQLL